MLDDFWNLWLDPPHVRWITPAPYLQYNHTVGRLGQCCNHLMQLFSQNHLPAQMLLNVWPGPPHQAKVERTAQVLVEHLVKI